jgi:hypothetical protein
MRRRGASGAAAAAAALLALCIAAAGASDGAVPRPPAAAMHSALARAVTAEAALPPDLTAALESLGAQLDACGAEGVDADDITRYMSAQGGFPRLADDLRAVDLAAQRCGVAVEAVPNATHAPIAPPGFAMWNALSRESSEALRSRMRDLGFHLKRLRDMVTPCVLAAPGDAPPHEGAWFLNDWLGAARDAMEARRGCLARAPQPALLAVGGGATCGCLRAASVAAAATFASTAAAAGLIGALLRRRAQPWNVGMPRRRARGAAALGQSPLHPFSGGDASSPVSEEALKKRHSLSGPEPPRPYRPLEMGLSPRPAAHHTPV